MFLKFSESMFNEVSVYSCRQFPLWDVQYTVSLTFICFLGSYLGVE